MALQKKQIYDYWKNIFDLWKKGNLGDEIVIKAEMIDPTFSMLQEREEYRSDFHEAQHRVEASRKRAVELQKEVNDLREQINILMEASSKGDDRLKAMELLLDSYKSILKTI